MVWRKDVLVYTDPLSGDKIGGPTAAVTCPVTATSWLATPPPACVKEPLKVPWVAPVRRT